MKNLALPDVIVDVVLGDTAPHINEIKSFVSDTSYINLHIGLPSLAKLTAVCDLEIGACGVHSWERACLGLPALVIPVANNQTQLMSDLVSIGVVKAVRHSNKGEYMKSLPGLINDLIQDQSHLSSMSRKGFDLVDGYGSDRVITRLLDLSPKVFLRPADRCDSRLYFEWVTDPTVRSASLPTKPITWDQHSIWFESQLSSEHSLMFVLEDSRSLPLGQIRFDKSFENTLNVVISFSLDPVARGLGLGSKLLALGLVELKKCWGQIKGAYAVVKYDNLASARIFSKSGFKKIVSKTPNAYTFYMNLNQFSNL